MIKRFKDLKFYIFAAVYLGMGGIGSMAITAYLTKSSRGDDKIISSCAKEIEKRMSEDKSISINFDFDNSFVINTRNPNIWLVFIGFSGSKNAVSVNMQASCRVHEKNGEFKIDGIPATSG